MRRQILPLLLLTAATLRAADFLPPATQPAAPTIPTILSTEIICHLPTQRTKTFRLITNQDMTQVAALDTWDKDKYYLSLNNVLWEFYTAVDAPSAQFDPTGMHLLLLAQHDNAWFLIKDNADFRLLGTGPCHHLILSRDAKHDACIQTLPNHQLQILLDGKPFTPANAPATFDEISTLSFNPDTHQLTFLARKDRKAYLVTSGTLLTTTDADQISPLVFSPDAKHAAWATLNRGNRAATVSAMLDGKNLSTYIVEEQFSVSHLTISQNAASVGWIQSDADASWVVVNDKVSRPKWLHSVSQLAISPDGKHVAAIVKSDFYSGRDTLVIDDDLIFGDIAPDAPLVFSNDNKSLLYTALGKPQGADLAGTHWSSRMSSNYLSPDGRINIVSSGVSTLINSSIHLEGHLLAASTDNAERAYVLVESPRTLVIEKPLTTVTRIVLHLPTHQTP